MDSSSTERRLARLRTRLLSLVYEALVLTALLLVSTAIFTAIFGDSREEPLHVVLQVYLASVAGAFYIWSWTGGRRTLPMRTWRMRLIDEGGQAPSTRRALLRYLFALAGYLLCGVSLIWTLIDREQLFLHDRLAGTRLVMDPAPPKP